jgi:formate hydrogenlyase subunit 6/NADH:ubiquinone oxidoreductase subunit I
MNEEDQRWHDHYADQAQGIDPHEIIEEDKEIEELPRPELFHLCDYCQFCFDNCDGDAKFLFDHPNVALYQRKYPDRPDLADLVYQCHKFDDKGEN